MLRTSDQHRAALQDGREVYYRGRRIDDVLAEPELRVAVDHAAIDFDLAHDPANRDLMVAKDPETGDDISAYYRIPRSAEDLLARSKLIETVTAAGGTMVTLIKEIGTDALLALQRTAEGEELERIRRFYRHCAENDLALCVGQTDVKGDRSKGPSEQADPDMYMRIVSSNDEGIVVRGAKVHTSVSVNADEIIVLPTRAMGAGDADYAVSFAVPMNTKGLKLYVSSYAAGDRNDFEFPLSSRHKMLETLTVFDDVFVPWERVFLFREPEKAGALALTFVEYHRFTAVSYKLPLVDALVGAAGVIAEMNGVIRAGHVRDKLTHLIIYAETVRALTEQAANRFRVGAHDIAYPDPLTTNMAKYTFATTSPPAIELVQDCAGGLLVTGPGAEDWENPEIRSVLE
ncbi:MAG: 4-hydroxyphenylacetate 3-hydroxylase N-terminal domain-containing protein, partial [Acidimicrobiia bacterium]